MKTPSNARARRLAVCWFVVGCILLAVTGSAMAAEVQPGVSHELAVERAGWISGLTYRLGFTLKEHASAIEGTETVAFESKAAGALPIDYRDGMLKAATVNGRAVALDEVNGHLMLPVVAGRNVATFAFESHAAAAGKAITRYEDKDDGSEYFYTLFVPMDASMAFPCFDQPDLKGRFTLTLEHPEGWTAIGNTAGVKAGGTVTKFAETRPISTYLFAFAAGPFAAVVGTQAGEPTVYVRKSQLARAKQEAPQVQSMVARGVKYFSDYFQQPFPFPKYDLVLIPGFPFGGMEHAGETFLNEDGVLFRTTPTASDYFHRDILVLHETCHQWFGDLVTMRWFDDLWLKEGFAQYMAYKALAQLEPATNPWKHFYDDIKPLAYGIDETEGTTPISQHIANLKDAKSAYGAIVYEKAPAVLKQLNFFLGDEAFRDGLRIYLRQHAYANAEWADLIGAFGVASEQVGERKDVQGWAAAWILRRGMPQVEVSWSCAGGRVSEFVLRQKDVLRDGYVWPMSLQVLLASRDAAKPDVMRVDWSGVRYEVKGAVGKACPAYVFANYGDEGYGRFLLDPVSERAMRPVVPSGDALLHSMLWGALWENVRLAQTEPRGFVELALGNLPLDEKDDETLVRVQAARLATALHSYMPDAMREELAPRVETEFAREMQANPKLDLRIVNFRAFTAVAETPAALGMVKEMLAGKLVIPGMPLKPLDRWNLVGHLIAMKDADAEGLYAQEKARDKSGEGQKYAYAVAAGEAASEVKARYFEEYLQSRTIQEDWITASLGPFNAWNQGALTAPYLKRALDELPDVKAHRKIFFLGAWLGTFMGGQNTIASAPAAQAVVRAWLAGGGMDPDLRLKVLEYSDALDRTVKIRERFYP
ncbi:MAG: M1 family aminopeptidase [Acidobacteriaceae bacterium]